MVFYNTNFSDFIDTNSVDTSHFDINDNYKIDLFEYINYLFSKLQLIVLIGLIYFFIGSMLSYYFKNYILIKIDKKEKNKLTIILSLCYEISILLIMVYFTRQIVKYILLQISNNFKGIIINRIKEINGNIVLSLAFLMFIGDDLRLKVKHLIESFK